MFLKGVAIPVLVLTLAACVSATEPPQTEAARPEPSITSADPVTAPAFPSPSASVSQDVGDVVLTQNGIGGLRLERDVLSLSVTDVEKWLDRSLFMAPQTERCSLGIEEDLGIALVTNEDSGVLGFVVDNSEVVTPEGIKVGSSADELQAAYGEAVRVLDGVVSQTGGPLVFVDDLELTGEPPGPRTLHFGFDTDEAGTVTRLRSGFWPWVGYTDYCSLNAEHLERTGWPLEVS